MKSFEDFRNVTPLPINSTELRQGDYFCLTDELVDSLFHMTEEVVSDSPGYWWLHTIIWKNGYVVMRDVPFNWEKPEFMNVYLLYREPYWSGYTGLRMVNWMTTQDYASNKGSDEYWSGFHDAIGDKKFALSLEV